MLYEYIFWDWNGTLLDDAHIAFDAVNAMLGARKLNKITFEQYCDYIDVPIIKFYERVLDMSKESMDGIAAEFNSYCESFMPKNPLANGAKTILKLLNKNGIKQYIYSSSKRDRIIPMLEKTGIDVYFEEVIASSDLYAGSKAERTRDYIINNSIPKEKCLFIGDLVHDCETASLVGADCLLVAYGHQNKTTLQKTGRRVIDSLFELPEYLNINSEEVVK
ncbi:MAG: HAD family hydrolase [Clostridia bacterium]|nr:HAD family hydrolase [Clostridia bacterium]